MSLCLHCEILKCIKYFYVYSPKEFCFLLRWLTVTLSAQYLFWCSSGSPWIPVHAWWSLWAPSCDIKLLLTLHKINKIPCVNYLLKHIKISAHLISQFQRQCVNSSLTVVNTVTFITYCKHEKVFLFSKQQAHYFFSLCLHCTHTYIAVLI